MDTKPINPRMTAREWLRENGYSDFANIIDSFIEFNKLRGSGERRNYWDILAGRKNGECFNRHGFIFPVLESVRSIRKPNYKPSPKAIKRNKIEVVPLPVKQVRWENK